MKKYPFFTALLVIVFGLSACAEMHRDKRSTANDLVNQATETVQRFKSMPDLKKFANYMPNARGIVVLPSVIKGGFLLGGEGGNGVLLAKTDNGSWSSPAFYALGAASFGIQMGLQDTEIILVLRSDEAVTAILEHQGKLGADAGLTLGTIGKGVEISTTANIGVDILAFANSKIGLFGGAALEGAVLVRRVDLNEAYYGQGTTPRGILYQGQGQNPQANGLRDALAGS
ncbi:MAG TPA: lipid-binding SYLF domain-containing protein [Rhodospirillales bacterium]|nr:lipid-binding SYLF domain-containing protein [Rhodospirillales bacterium]|tara:strand:- start:40 stop:726 length:687 start_codon:yes stop_codon:yes gene_type:complete